MTDWIGAGHSAQGHVTVVLLWSCSQSFKHHVGHHAKKKETNWSTEQHPSILQGAGRRQMYVFSIFLSKKTMVDEEQASKHTYPLALLHPRLLHQLFGNLELQIAESLA